jgi:hypothetical protein
MRRARIVVLAVIVTSSAWPVLAGRDTTDLGAASLTGAEPGSRVWALVINGDSELIHRSNVDLALGTLKRLGVPSQRTVVLSPRSDSSQPTFGEWQEPSRAGFAAALAELRRQIHPGDVLFVYLTGHADRRFGKTVLELRAGTVTDEQLARHLAELGAGRLFLVADPCFSGGFGEALQRLAPASRTATSTDSRHKVQCTLFIRPFWAALARAAVALESPHFEGTFSDAFTAASSFARPGSPSRPAFFSSPN